MAKRMLETPWRTQDYPYFRWSVVDDFSENKGYAMLETTHAWADGINIISALKIMCDDHSEEGVKPAKPPPLSQILMKYAIQLPVMLKLLYFLLSRPKAKNAMKKL